MNRQKDHEAAVQYEKEARYDAWLDSIEEPNDPNRDEWLERMNQEKRTWQ